MCAGFTFSTSANAITINLTDKTPGGSTSTQLAAFNTAANIWQNLLIDRATISIDIAFTPLGPGIIGATATETSGAFYDDIRTALNADQRSAVDAAAVSNLQPGPSLAFLANDPTNENLFVDNNGTGNNFVLDVPNANLKALGLQALISDPNLPDAIIEFSNAFPFDFDRSNGITPGELDFVGVATHEIGHALGFVSGVDIVDITSLPNGPFAPFGLDDFRVFSVLDLYRYSGESLFFGALTGLGPIQDLAFGANDPNFATFFSVDAGATNLGSFTTGAFNGDGRQASHWRDDALIPPGIFSPLGVMDPTLPFGVTVSISSLDLIAFDAIGYDLITEPTTLTIFGLGLAGLGYMRRRRAS